MENGWIAGLNKVWDLTLGVLFNPGHFLSFAPLFVAFAIAFLVVVTRRAKKAGLSGLQPRRILSLLFPKRVFFHKSAKLDYAVFIINQFVLFFITISAFLSPAIVSEIVVTIGGYIGLETHQTDVTIATRITYSIFLMLLWDFSATYTHYLKHKVPILWELHKVHHSAAVMTPVTALRRHPLEAIFSSGFTALVIGLGVGVWVLVLGQEVMPYNLFGTLIGIWIWRVSGYNLRHSHIWISYGNFWNRIFISPAQHQVHHSKSPEHYDTNFGHIFAFWDKLLGTLYLPKFEERMEFGIDDHEMPEYQSLFGLYITPCVKIWHRLTAKDTPSQTPAE